VRAEKRAGKTSVADKAALKTRISENEKHAASFQNWLIRNTAKPGLR